MSRPFPASTYTEPRYRLPGSGERAAHRLKRDPSRYLCRVSLCGLFAEGWEWTPVRKPQACAECERAAREEERDGTQS